MKLLYFISLLLICVGLSHQIDYNDLKDVDYGDMNLLDLLVSQGIVPGPVIPDPPVESPVDPNPDPSVNPPVDPNPDPAVDSSVDPNPNPAVDQPFIPNPDPTVDPTADGHPNPAVNGTGGTRFRPFKKGSFNRFGINKVKKNKRPSSQASQTIVRAPQATQTTTKEQGVIYDYLRDRFRIFFGRSIDFLLKKVSVKLSSFGQYRFRTQKGNVFLVSGLGNFNLADFDNIRITKSPEDGKLEISTEIVVGPLTFLSELSDPPSTEALLRYYTVPGQLTLTVSEQDENKLEFKSFTLGEKFKEYIFGEQEKTMKEFFDSLIRTGFKGDIIQVIEAVIKEKETTEVFSVFLK